MPLRRARRWSALAAALPLLLGVGCSGDEDPEPIVTEPPASQSPSPSASPAAQPQPWEKRTKAGAVAFVEHWVEIINRATQTGEVAELESLAAAGCRTCSELASAIRSVYRDGGEVRGGTFEVLRVATNSKPTDDPVEVLSNVRVSEQQVLSADGDVVTDADPADASLRFELQWNGTAWLVQDVVQA